MPLIKLDARWALPVYPVLKAQSHAKKVLKHLTKKQQQYNPILGLEKNNDALINGHYHVKAIKHKEEDKN